MDAAAAAKHAEQIERREPSVPAKEEAKSKDPFRDRRSTLKFLFTFMAVFPGFHRLLIRKSPGGPVTAIFDLSMIAIGVIGLIVLFVLDRKNKK